MRLRRTVRAIALFEATKGTLVLLMGLGALSLVHHDVQRIVMELGAHLHLNPAKKYQNIFVEAAAHLTDARLWVLATLAATYAVVRFCEGLRSMERKAMGRMARCWQWRDLCPV